MADTPHTKDAAMLAPPSDPAGAAEFFVCLLRPVFTPDLATVATLEEAGIASCRPGVVIASEAVGVEWKLEFDERMGLSVDVSALRPESTPIVPLAKALLQVLAQWAGLTVVM